MTLFDWITALLDWMRNPIGEKKQEPIRSLKTLYSRDRLTNAKLLYKDGQFPGLVELWKVSHHESEIELILILSNIAQAREELVKPKFGKNQEVRRAFELQARTALREQAGILGSHLFISGWLTVEPIVVRSDGTAYKHLDCTTVLVVDLQGVTRTYMGDNGAARRVMHLIIKKILTITPGEYNSWDEIMRSLSEPESKTHWGEWLETFAKGVLGDRHTLQPPKGRG